MTYTSLMWVLVLATALLSGCAESKCNPPEKLCSNCVADPAYNASTVFHYGSTLKWSCLAGYVMAGDGEVVVQLCGLDAEWKGPTPSCVSIPAVTCGVPPVPAFGSLQGGPLEQYPVGVQVSYTCEPGYSLSGPRERSCDSGGGWTSPSSATTCYIECATGSRNGAHLCYYMEDGVTLNWESAQAASSSNGQELAMPRSRDAYEVLAGIMQHNPNDFWIGAKRGRGWRWNSDGSYITRLYWNYREPNFPDENCLELRRPPTSSSYAWNNALCGLRHGFICQAETTCASLVSNATVLPFTFGGKCFRFVRELRTWEEARLACSDRNYGYVAEIRNDETEDFLTSKARDVEVGGEARRWWIGGYEDGTDTGSSWFWVDGSRVTTTQWAPNEPKNNPEANCVMMTPEWSNAVCAEEKRSLTQKGRAECDDPGAPAHGSRTLGYLPIFVGIAVNFQCDVGFQLNGPEELTCIGNGRWNADSPTCEAVTCPDSPPPVPRTRDVTTTTTGYKGVAIYACWIGYLPTAPPVSICQANGTWSDPAFSCRAKKSSLLARATSSRPMIAGVTTALLLLLLLILVVVIVVRRRKSCRSDDSEEDEPCCKSCKCCKGCCK